MLHFPIALRLSANLFTTLGLATLSTLSSSVLMADTASEHPQLLRHFDGEQVSTLLQGKKCSEQDEMETLLSGCANSRQAEQYFPSSIAKTESMQPKTGGMHHTDQTPDQQLVTLAWGVQINHYQLYHHHHHHHNMGDTVPYDTAPNNDVSGDIHAPIYPQIVHQEILTNTTTL
ncbi:MAG: hypothetical protein P8077_01670, partial [Gammaproteobacteria bacterium]